MQKILIGVNTDIQEHDGMVDLLVKELGRNQDYWYEFTSDAYLEGNSLKYNYMWRMNEDIHKALQKHDYIIGEFYNTPQMVKIVEIPDDVKWHIKSYQCDTGEYIAEDYRTWGIK